MRPQVKGFTLIELLTVLGIIALIAGIIIANATSTRSIARDGTRVADLGVLQNALGRYFVDHKNYPATLSVLVTTYLPELPVDPSTRAPYVYAAITTSGSAATCESYHLGAVLENAGFAGLSQDRDITSVGSLCTGSAADFNGNAASCSGISAGSTDGCFDVAP